MNELDILIIGSIQDPVFGFESFTIKNTGQIFLKLNSSMVYAKWRTSGEQDELGRMRKNRYFDYLDILI